MDFISWQFFKGMYVGSVSAFLDQFGPLYSLCKYVSCLFPYCCLAGYYMLQEFKIHFVNAKLVLALCVF